VLGKKVRNIIREINHCEIMEPAIINKRIITLICAWLLIFAAYISVLCVSPVLYLIIGEFKLTASKAGLLFSAPVITLALVAFIGGVWGDILGPRKIAGIGAILTGLSSVLRGIAPNFLILLILNLIVGVGWGLIFPNLPKLIRLWFPNRIIGTATGIYSTGVFVGCTIALAITIPFIFPIFGSWRGVFYFWGAIVFIIAAIWWLVVREPDLIEKKDNKLEQPYNLKLSLLTVIKNKNIWICAIFFALAANITFYIVTGWFPTFFIEKGFNTNSAGILTSIITFASIPAVFFIPFASDKVGLRKPFLWISSIIAAILFIATIFSSFAVDIIIMIFLGISLTASYVISLFLPLELVKSKENAGTASGLIISIGYIGGALGPLIAGFLKDIMGTLKPALIMLAVLMVISVVLVFLLPETGSKKV